MAPYGRLYVGGQDRAFDSKGVISFLKYLCHRFRSKNPTVIWDEANIHRSQAVKDILSRKKGRVHLLALPSYSPDLNPVEHSWSKLKRELKNRVFLSLEEFAGVLIRKAEEFGKDAKPLVSFFHKTEVAFFTG